MSFQDDVTKIKTNAQSHLENLRAKGLCCDDLFMMTHNNGYEVAGFVETRTVELDAMAGKGKADEDVAAFVCAALLYMDSFPANGTAKNIRVRKTPSAGAFSGATATAILHTIKTLDSPVNIEGGILPVVGEEKRMPENRSRLLSAWQIPYRG